MKCEECGKDLLEKDFYHYKTQNCSTTCKKCECRKYNENDFCKKYNIPNIKREWNNLYERYHIIGSLLEQRYYTYGRHLAKMKLKGYQEFGYNDTDFFNSWDSKEINKDINIINSEIKEYENKGGNTNLISDGTHTFGDLYKQRAYLFAAIVNLFPARSYKSWRHSDGERCFGSEDWFIVGIVTPEGQYTYHYEKKYWNLFKCGEVDKAPTWDGHTDKDVDRLLSLAQEV